MAEERNNENPFRQAWRKLAGGGFGAAGLAGIGALFFCAVFAPLLANGRPLIAGDAGGRIVFPFLRAFFAPDSPEFFIEKCFNWMLLALLILPWLGLLKCAPKWKWLIAAAGGLLLTIPFFLVTPKMDKTDYREQAKGALFAPIPYGPFETAGVPLEKPSGRHWMGTDPVGRDVASRMIYGSRVSLAVGLGSTLIALAIGTAVGLAAGYFRGWFDLVTMRFVEIVMCFPTFLLLLILMSILKDRQFEQSVLIVIAVLGLTGWIGLAFLVRGEVLRQCALPYIQSCRVAGIPSGRVMMRHLLPNIAGPILITFSFGVAGAILAESGLSFLGFGVQPPTASWGGLLREAFDDPLQYWHLTVFPGIGLFVAVAGFNITGEALRRAVAGR